MVLTQSQLTQFENDGFLRFEKLFSDDEVALMKSELARVGAAESDSIIKERTGSVRTIYRCHEPDGPTASPVFHNLARTPRLLRPAQQVLNDDELYVYHCKNNIKTAIDGTVWLWHQDYGFWQHDGVPTANMATYLVMLDEATEFGGSLYFVPGSHRGPTYAAYKDEQTTSYPQWAIEKPVIQDLLRRGPRPVAITGSPGTAVLFHCKVVHASGHNLSPNDRWHAYMAYNPTANRPNPVPENPRPDYVVSRNYTPLHLLDHDDISTPPLVTASR